MLQQIHRRGELTVRSYVTYRINGQGTPQQARAEIERIPFVTGWGDDWLRVGSLKIVMDGGILIGTAYLREPYGQHTDVYGYHDPSYRGVLAVPRECSGDCARGERTGLADDGARNWRRFAGSIARRLRSG